MEQNSLVGKLLMVGSSASEWRLIYIQIANFIYNINLLSSFSRVEFVLLEQEGEDVSFSDNNFLFFLSGDDTGKFYIYYIYTVVCIVCH